MLVARFNIRSSASVDHMFDGSVGWLLEQENFWNFPTTTTGQKVAPPDAKFNKQNLFPWLAPFGCEVFDPQAQITKVYDKLIFSHNPPFGWTVFTIVILSDWGLLVKRQLVSFPGNLDVRHLGPSVPCQVIGVQRWARMVIRIKSQGQGGHLNTCLSLHGILGGVIVMGRGGGGECPTS